MANELESKWRFRDALHERNASDVFWATVKAYIDGGEKAALEKAKGSDPHIMQNIAVKHITENTSVMFVQVTRGTLAYIVLRILFRMGCKECIKNLVRDASGSIYITVGLSRFIDEVKDADALVKELIADEEAGIEMMKAMKRASPSVLSSFLAQIRDVARNDIGEKQYLALGMLAEHTDNPEIKAIFIGFLDDWDIEVRKMSALSLLTAKKDKEISDAASKALELETDETVKALRGWLKKNYPEFMYPK